MISKDFSRGQEEPEEYLDLVSSHTLEPEWVFS
jgi:hypothetical protein